MPPSVEITQIFSNEEKKLEILCVAIFGARTKLNKKILLVLCKQRPCAHSVRVERLLFVYNDDFLCLTPIYMCCTCSMNMREKVLFGIEWINRE